MRQHKRPPPPATMVTVAGGGRNRRKTQSMHYNRIKRKQRHRDLPNAQGLSNKILMADLGHEKRTQSESKLAATNNKGVLLLGQSLGCDKVAGKMEMKKKRGAVMAVRVQGGRTQFLGFAI